MYGATRFELFLWQQNMNFIVHAPSALQYLNALLLFVVYIVVTSYLHSKSI